MTTFSGSDFSIFEDKCDLIRKIKAEGFAYSGRIKALLVIGVIRSDGKIRNIQMRTKSIPKSGISITAGGSHSIEMYTDAGRHGVISFEPYQIVGNRKPAWGFNVIVSVSDGLNVARVESKLFPVAK